MVGRPPKPRAPDDTLPKVEAVERALNLLDAFREDAPLLTLKQLADAAGLYPSTVLRLAGSLERFGYLRRDPDGRYRLGPGVARLSKLYRAGFPFENVIRPVLRHLSEESGETAAFYVREGDARLCLYRINGPRPLRSHLEEGSLLPLGQGASGHILRAYTDRADAALEPVRQNGFSVSRGERDPDSAAVAAPVFGADGAFVGVIGLSGPITRFDADAIMRLKPLVKAQAEALSALLQRG